MATTDDSNDALWNQSVCNKSWIDIMEEEERGVLKKNSLRDSTNTKRTELRVPIKDELIEDESAVDITISSETKEIKIQPNDVLPNFSISHIRSEEDSSKENSTQCRPNEQQPKDFLQDDLSLTSHLHGFQLVSPCKVDHKTPTKTPSKVATVSHYLGKGDRGEGTSSPSQVTKRKLQTDELKDSAMTDEMLMPSPSKIRRQATPLKKSLQNTPKQKNTPKQQITPNFLSYTPTNRLTRKRSRELTPGSSERKREVETDPDVLARRQKQIDYGKNTVGYDRYRQLVPKEARQKIHPKTPPIHVKFSRRAWDGLVKVWRQRLHFWDPPSEGGGDPKCLEMDEMSDASSTDGSLPPTPVQDRKRQCWQRTPGGLSKEQQPTTSSQPEEDDDDQGCTPLPPE